ncbi:MAG: peptidylprolyl isomerase [Spirochaetaceae bacterium]
MHFVNQKRYTPLLFVLFVAVVFAISSCGSAPEEVQEPAEDTESVGEAEQQEPSEGEEQIEIGDEPVARVNGVPIFQSELERFVENNRRQMAQQGRELSEEDMVMVREQVLSGLINREVLLQQAGELDLHAQEAAVETQMSNIRGQFGSDEEYENALSQQNLTEEELRDNIETQLTINQLLQQEVYSEIEVTQEEKESFYEENPELFQEEESVDASHILITTEGLNEEEKEEARRRAEEIREEVVDGADFNEVAREKSEGPSAPNGGRLGSFQRGQMVPAFEEAAFDLEAGEISEVVETEFGYHIILVTDKSEGRSRSFEEAESQIQQYLQENKSNEELESYVERLRADAEVEVLLDEFDAQESESGGGS